MHMYMYVYLHVLIIWRVTVAYKMDTNEKRNTQFDNFVNLKKGLDQHQ